MAAAPHEAGGGLTNDVGGCIPPQRWQRYKEAYDSTQGIESRMQIPNTAQLKGNNVAKK
jgi:hypothetical protein